MSTAALSPAIETLKSLLNTTLRITVTDGRIFIGTFLGTDQPLNILLMDTEEFRVGPDERPDGRYVGQVLIPWKMVVKIEAQGREPEGNSIPMIQSVRPGSGYII